MNEEIRKLLLLINSCGYEAYLVGGAVRDSFIGIPNHDFDIASNIPSEKLQELLPSIKFMKDNSRRHTGVVRTNDMVVEISSFKGNSIVEDLSNRDFTINAIAMDGRGNIIDPYNGVEDIKRKRISLIKDDGEAFQIDPLRILRAIRQSDKLGFVIDDNCKEKMVELSRGLTHVAGERIYSELSNIIVSPAIGIILEEYKEIFFAIIPELKILNGFDQKNPYHIYDIYTHTIKVVENTRPDLVLRLAALFHDIGKPSKFTIDENGKGHFYNHQEASNDIFLEISKRLKMDKKTRTRVSKLIRTHEMDLSRKKTKIYNFLEKYDIEELDLLFELKEADIKGQNPELLYRLEELYTTQRLYYQVVNRINYFNTIIVPKLTKLYDGHNIRPIIHDLRREYIIGKKREEQDFVSYISKRV